MNCLIILSDVFHQSNRQTEFLFLIYIYIPFVINYKNYELNKSNTVGVIHVYFLCQPIGILSRDDTHNK